MNNRIDIKDGEFVGKYIPKKKKKKPIIEK
jgi:hypothetical protein